MEHCKFPLDLIDSYLLPHLPWNDILRFRRLSKACKEIADSYIKTKLGGIPATVQIEIDDLHKTAPSFLQLGFPAQNFYLNNYYSNYHFFDNPDILNFVDIYGSQITTLRVHMISINLVKVGGGERYFYERLSNLGSLWIDTAGKSKRLGIPEYPWTTHADLIHAAPKCFQNLKFLRTPKEKYHSRVSGLSMSLFNFRCLNQCQNLEELTLGFRARSINAYSMLILAVEHAVHILPHVASLKILDFQNHPFIDRSDVTRSGSPTMLELCRRLWLNGGKMRNVPANMFKALDPETDNPAIIGDVVQSMLGLHPTVLRTGLWSLEVLSVTTSAVKSFQNGEAHDTTWPALKLLEVIVDTEILPACCRNGQRYRLMEVSELFGIFFGGTPRLSLEGLRMQFAGKVKSSLPVDVNVMLGLLPDIAVNPPPFPEVIDVVKGCPNLTKLEIKNWPGGDSLQFSQFWGLKCLEEVKLSKCKPLGDAAFIGEDEINPAFLKLKKLRKLYLIDLDKMPLLTDRVFQTVFRNLQVSHFVLRGEKPLKSITKSGIVSLLSGKFAESVEHFPFYYWSLSGVRKEELLQLSHRFRSSNML